MVETHIETWRISDELWKEVKPRIPHNVRIPDKSYRRKLGGGKKSHYSDRLYFSAIIYVLRSGIAWSALPRRKFENITPQAVHKKFMQWSRVGFFQELWNAGLMEHDGMKGIAWEWQSTDEPPQSNKTIDSPLAGKRKTGSRQKNALKRQWRPVVSRRIRNQST